MASSPPSNDRLTATSLRLLNESSTNNNSRAPASESGESEASRYTDASYFDLNGSPCYRGKKAPTWIRSSHVKAQQQGVAAWLASTQYKNLWKSGGGTAKSLWPRYYGHQNDVPFSLDIDPELIPHPDGYPATFGYLHTPVVPNGKKTFTDSTKCKPGAVRAV